MQILIQKIKSIKENYLSRSPKGKWYFVFQIALFFLRLCGSGSIDLNFKVTWTSFTVAFAVLDNIVSFL